MKLSDFHPAVSGWFAETFDAPTDVQLRGWHAIREGRDTLIAAPTGSGKTLAAFLAVIDDLAQRAADGALEDGVQIVYVSPLRALSNDIEKNLRDPLAAITERLNALGVDKEITVGLRTGDTSSSQRAKMVKKPPHILVSTPESLYILLGSDGGRSMLRSTRAVIVDEIHALTPDRRGAHMSLTLERLQHLAPDAIRIGLSATQSPIELVGRFLVGTRRAMPQIVDAGHVRNLDLQVEVTGSPLAALMSAEAMEEVYDRLAELIEEHTTTLVFTNTRREAERITSNLEKRLGPGNITAHHGALARDRRFEAEQALRSGELKALVATASLELGIDVGAVDLVCQMGSVRSVSTLLQRVGRSGHHLGGTPKGRVFPLTLDELVEAAALLRLVRAEQLDLLELEPEPLDLLAQHIVAAAGNEEWEEDELFELVRGSANYAEVAREKFDAILAMLADGFTTRRGRRSAHIHWDQVNHRIRGRRGARLTAITSGGAIPDRADYRVVMDHDETVVGTLDEEFAIESMAGDIFQLGNTSWQIHRVDSRRGEVRVFDAHGKPPTLPIWFGEAPARTHAVSDSVSRVREEIEQRLSWTDTVEVGAAVDWARDALGLGVDSAEQLVAYLAASREALTAMPTQDRIVIERFFDEAENTHLVVHSPFGSRLNRGWGLALRKRFCKSFNFELQAAANEDAIILSMGPTHSFPLEEVFDFLSSTSVRHVLIQALLDSPMFGTRWRWNLNRSLAVPRWRGGKKVPPALQRMQAEDLLAVVFPDQLACLENIAGDREVPDHPLVDQTIFDCLHEAMDIEGLEHILRRIEGQDVEMIARDVREPSPLAHQIINARPYAYLDDAPLEERRTMAIQTRGMLDPKTVGDLAVLDTQAVDRVREEVAADIRDADELHDALVCRGYMTEGEVADHDRWLAELANQRRIARVEVGDGLWFAVERAPEIVAVFGRDRVSKELTVPERFAHQPDQFDALVALFRSRLEFAGPIVAQAFVDEMELDDATVQSTLIAIEGSGFVFRGQFDQREPREQWCERTLLARIHRYTLARLRREIEPVSPVNFMRFLLDWQHVSPAERLRGPDGVAAVLEQLSGVEVAAGAWESEILASRMVRYDGAWLDMACMSGRFVWGRLRGGGGRAPVRTSPMTITLRAEHSVWCESTELDLSPNAQRVLDTLETSGARFFEDLSTECRLLRAQAEEALAELVAAGAVTADSFGGLRALLVPSSKRPRSGNRRRGIGAMYTIDAAGRWATLSREETHWSDADVERVARRLLERWGVVVRVIVRRETKVGWRRLLACYRAMEARGEIRGGRFVNGVGGEQFALPEAVAEMRRVRRAPADGELVSISACDPLNLTGVLLGDERIPALLGHRIVLQDGNPVATWDGKEVRHLADGLDPAVDRIARQLPEATRLVARVT